MPGGQILAALQLAGEPLDVNSPRKLLRRSNDILRAALAKMEADQLVEKQEGGWSCLAVALFASGFVRSIRVCQ